jgi:acetyl-CoA synthetase
VQGIYCFLILNEGVEISEELVSGLKKQVRSDIGPIATPDYIQIAPGLPKTRSGKIMRRILRKIAENNYGDLGDTNTLTNPEVVDQLIEGRLNR